jgi:hypothetical protein
MSPLNWSIRDCLRRVGLLAVAAAGILSILATSGDDDDTPSYISPGGIWNGAFTATTGSDFGPAQALISETGTAHFIRGDARRTQFSGFFALSETPDFEEALSLLDPSLGIVLVLDTSGTIFPRNQIIGTYEDVPSGSAGTLAFTYDPIYERGSSLTAISGTWSDGTRQLSIDAAGMISGAATGQIELLNPALNLYRVTLDDPSHPFGLELEGLATLSDTTVANDTLIYAVRTPPCLCFINSDTARFTRQP